MTAQARESFWHDGGMEHGGTLRADDDPMVVRYPSLYERIDDEPVDDEPVETPAAPVKRRPGRPRKAVAGG